MFQLLPPNWFWRNILSEGVSWERVSVFLKEVLILFCSEKIEVVLRLFNSKI